MFFYVKILAVNVTFIFSKTPLYIMLNTALTLFNSFHKIDN